jgi:DNA-binding response OmpR family regulator
MKPCNIDEIFSVLKKAAKVIYDNNLFEITLHNGSLYNIKENTISYKDTVIKLTALEKSFMDLLLANQTKYISKELIQFHLWEENEVSENAFKSLVNKVRKKIGKGSLVNQSGIGYKLILKQI